MIGISVKRAKGLGDTVQFSSVPENYFAATGQKLVDVDRSWIFDHNPYVIRDTHRPPRLVRDLWNFSPMQYDWPVPKAPRPPVYSSNAELHALVMGVEPVLIRPRLYAFEDVKFESRKKILMHVDGVSHGKLPRKVIDHLIAKYEPTGHLYLIGRPDETFGLRHIETPTFWDLVRVISDARMLVGCDSGPSWIAACYPDIVVKKVRTRFGRSEQFKTWTPLEVQNFHSHWDDRAFQIFNASETDVGPFQSYLRM